MRGNETTAGKTEAEIPQSRLMSAPSAKMFVSVGEQSVFVKINGEATFVTSIDFKTLLDELLQKGYTYFALELAGCRLMDSTFLGVLVGYALKMRGPQADQTGCALELFNPGPRITELLDCLGVLHLFKITQGELPLPEETEAHDPAPSNPTREEVKRTCLEAHQTLMAVNPDNVSRFKEVTQFLAEDLRKLKAGKS